MKRQEIRQLQDPAQVERLVRTLCTRDAFSALDASLLAKLVRHGALVELGQGEALIRETDAGAPEFYLLVEGALVVQSAGAFIARLDQPGDVAGEMAVLMSSKRSADVVAETAVRAVAIPSKALALPEFAPVAEGLRGVMLRDDWIKY
ncbi:MAG: cyclic nucleotide-binding domain-containing protein [Gammaproteobacteria bacterium]